MLDQEYSSIKLDKNDWVLNVTLNRPKARNAMSLEMVGELGQVFTALESDLSIRAVVLRGEGGHFCAGGDIQILYENGFKKNFAYGQGPVQQRLKRITIHILN